jgi:regulatory protein
MKITGLKSQINAQEKLSVFIDNKYAFSLSQTEVLKLKLKTGQELSASEAKNLKQLAEQDKLYTRTLKLVARRSKSEWEVKNYLVRKGASPSLISTILNKLTDLNLINDLVFAENYVNYLQSQSPASRRKILAKLKQKHISDEVINLAMANNEINEIDALSRIVSNKIKQTKYKDSNKLMAYLSRQGFSYSLIKQALENYKQSLND